MLFPLADPTQRARSHSDDVVKEDPLILEPGGLQDPRDHIRFRIATAYALSERGEVTINCLKLNRPHLEQGARLGYYDMLSNLMDIVLCYGYDPIKELEPMARKSLGKLQKIMGSSEIFSSMAVDFVTANPLPSAT